MPLFKVNLNVDDYSYGEILRIDRPDLFADYIEAGFFTECDDEGQRIIDLSVDEQGSDVRTVEARTVKPVPLRDDDLDPAVRAQLDALHEQVAGADG